jgi:hypothetical protein
VAAGERADPAAEEVARGADVEGGAGDRHQAVLSRGLGDRSPAGAAADRRDLCSRIDLDAVEGGGVDEQAGGDRGVGAVAARLDVDLVAVLGGEAQCRRGVLGGRGSGDEVRGVDDGGVEARRGLGESVVAGSVNLSVDLE